MLQMLCVISMQEVMREPVLCVGDGASYEKRAMVQWLKHSNLSPTTGEPLATRDLLPNYTLKCMIQFAQAHS